MREEEMGMRNMGPLIKQDLAKLHLDGDSRRFALKSLQHIIEQLDATSVPKFLGQIADSRSCGESRSVAISLYEEVARIHGRLIKPYLPRVMSSLIRALAASRSSPQLQQACAKVTVAMARYTIDPSMSIEDAEEIIREICGPLVEALAGKLEPVAAGAAACIHALIETEYWRCAYSGIVQEVYHRLIVALSEKSTRTVFHLNLASALASTNPDTLGVYGAPLLRIGEETLKSAVDSWQHRKAAARLLQGVLTVLDKRTLRIELDTVIHALEICRFDKMPHVRLAVIEALHAANVLAPEDYSPSCGLVRSHLCKPKEQNQTSYSKRITEQTLKAWSQEYVLGSSMQKFIISPTCQESNEMSFSPAASTSTMKSMHIRQISTPVRSSSLWTKQTPPDRTRAMDFSRSAIYHSSVAVSPSTCSPDEGDQTTQNVGSKEDVMMGNPSVKVSLEGEKFVHAQVRANSMRVSCSFTDSHSPLPTSQIDELEVDIHTPEVKKKTLSENSVNRSASLFEKETVMTNCVPSGHVMSPIVSAILDELAETASSILAEDDAGLALLDSKIEESCIQKSEFKNLPKLRSGSSNRPEVRSRRCYAANHGSSSESLSSTLLQANEQRPSCGNRNVNEWMEDHDELNASNMTLAAADPTQDFAPLFEGNDAKFLRGCGPGEENVRKKHHKVEADLDLSPEEKSKPLITTKDFLPFATPKQLMRKLLSLDSSNSDSRRASLDQEVVQCQDEAVPNVVDLDVETSSEAGWSVRDNLIASDDSFQAVIPDEDEDEYRRKPPAEVFQELQSFQSSDCNSSRDIHMLSPVCRKIRPANCTEGGLHTEKTPNSTIQCVSNFPTSISIEASYCRNFDKVCSTRNSDSQMFMSIAAPASCGLAFKPSNLESFKFISSELLNEQHNDKVERIGPSSKCKPVNEGITAVEPPGKEYCRQGLSRRNLRNLLDCRDFGQSVILQTLLANIWRKFCRYGEIVLGGTLCMVLTLPLAMALIKLVTSPPDCLVPT